MVVRFGRFRWRAARPDDATEPAASPAGDRSPDADSSAEDAPPDLARAAIPAQPGPEQPVPLAPLADDGRPRVGVLLPVRRPRSLVPALPFPRVPKRAVFAVGICAGLAVPGLTRQIAGRALLAALGGDRPAPPVQAVERATLEVIRVTVSGSQRGQAAATVCKLLEILK